MKKKVGNKKKQEIKRGKTKNSKKKEKWKEMNVVEKN